MNSPTILFIHGMFLTGKSWEHWMRYFEQRGYRCLAPSWPLHEGEPAELRAHVPPGTGELALETVIAAYDRVAREQAERPILIGHSVGGLIAQQLIARGLGEAAVLISSVAPNRMLSLDWGFFRNSAAITNPLKGDAPYKMTSEGFHKNFANTSSQEESDRLYERYAVHESRNMLRDCLGEAGKIDLERPHAPLLFLAGACDEIIPAELCRKNAEAYGEHSGLVEFREFPGRGHFIYGQENWEEVAETAAAWLAANVGAAAW